jgi:hypothetical protein
LPSPVRGPGRFFWISHSITDEKQRLLHNYNQEENMNETLFSMKDVARLLRVQPYQIAYLLNTNRVPEPQMRLGNRRVFSAADIERLAERLNVRVPAEVGEGQHG